MITHRELQRLLRRTSDNDQAVQLVYREPASKIVFRAEVTSIHIHPDHTIEFHNGPVCSDAERVIDTVCWCKV
jgi:hypothetical protein